MCTVTWLRRNHNEYSVFFNRDEHRTRAPAHPPREQNRGGVRFVAPIDGDAGGTWLAANEHGLTLGLLNYYEAEHSWRAQHPMSRGILLMSLIDETEIDEITRRLRDMRPESYHPFILVAFDARVTRAHRWDGRHISIRDLAEDDLPLTTSSFDTDAVVARRSALFHRLRETKHGLSAQTLQDFHDSHDTHGAPYSVCMSREDAQTVSFSRVTVTPTQVEFFYQPRDRGHPAGPPSTAVLRRT